MHLSAARQQKHRLTHEAASPLERGRQALQQHRWVDAARLLAEATQFRNFTSLDWLGLAVARWKTADVDGTLEASSHCLAAEPRNVTARMVLTQALITLHRYDEAIAAFESMPQGETKDHNFHVNHGIALLRSGRPKEAVAPLMDALAQKMDFDLAYTTLGTAFKNLKLYEESVECFRTAAALDPENVLAHAFVAHMDQFACRWEQFESNRTKLTGAIKHVSAVRETQGAEATPFALVALPHQPDEFLSAARLEARRMQWGVVPFPSREQDTRPSRKLRIGYLSADFHQHATAMLLTEVLELRDTDKFDVTLYCHSPEDQSAARARLRKACEQFVEVHNLTPKQIAERVRLDEIDIFVDLKAYTSGNRFAAFAYRPAPIQVTWLGFPGTTGADFIDYIIGDPVVTPLAHASHFSEKIAQMPWCYQPNDRQRPKPRPTNRATWGLPEQGFIYGSFNQCYKITPDVFDVWMRILRQVPGSVLWQLDGGEQSRANLRKEACARGIDPARLIFAPPVAPEVHLSRVKLADLVLDTWPCNAHTTASDALWAGTPLLTHQQTVFASRVASSLLSVVGLENLVCDTTESYETMAVDLAHSSGRLAEMREHLTQAIHGRPLFDSAKFARDLESLYERMWERRCSSLPPDHLPAKPL